jgi:hypothetical protein
MLRQAVEAGAEAVAIHVHDCGQAYGRAHKSEWAVHKGGDAGLSLCGSWCGRHTHVSWHAGGGRQKP